MLNENWIFAAPEEEHSCTVTAESLALQFILPIWKSVNSEIKQKYGADTWNMFENFIRSSAAQPTLPLFLEKLKRVIKIEWHVEEQKQVLAFIRATDDDTALKLLRTEASYIVLIVRDANTQQKEARKAATAAVTQFNIFEQ